LFFDKKKIDKDSNKLTVFKKEVKEEKKTSKRLQTFDGPSQKTKKKPRGHKSKDWPTVFRKGMQQGEEGCL